MVQNCGVLKEKSVKNKVVIGEKNEKWFRKLCRRHHHAKENGKKCQVREVDGEKIAIQSCYFWFP